MIHRLSVSAILGLCGSLFVCAVSSGSDETGKDEQEEEKRPQPRAVLEISRYGFPFLVNVRVGGKEEDSLFLLDTGTVQSVLHPSLCVGLGAPVGTETRSTASGRLTVQVYTSPPLALNGLMIENARVDCSDLSAIRAGLGSRLSGVLGLSGIDRYCMEIDFASGKLKLWDERPGLDPKHRSTVLERGAGGAFRFNVAVGEITFPVLFDTGFNAELAIGSELFDELVKAGTLSETESGTTATPKGLHRSRRGTLARMTIAGCAVEDVLIFEMPGRVDAGSIGIGLLERFHVVADFPRDELWLCLREDYKRRYVHRLVGFLPAFTESGLLVYQVRDGSEAQEAGLSPRDVITHIDGRAMGSINIVEYVDLIASRGGETLQLTVRRAGAETSETVEFKAPKFTD